MGAKPRICRTVWDNFAWLTTDDARMETVSKFVDVYNVPPQGESFQQCCVLEEGQQCCNTVVLGRLCFSEGYHLFDAKGSSGIKKWPELAADLAQQANSLPTTQDTLHVDMRNRHVFYLHRNALSSLRTIGLQAAGPFAHGFL